MSGDQFHLRVTPQFRARLECLAAQRKTTLAGAIRSAVMQANAAHGDVPSEDEVLLLLSEAARCGSVPAMKELRAHHRERAAGDQDGLAQFDELAARRTAT